MSCDLKCASLGLVGSSFNLKSPAQSSSSLVMHPIIFFHMTRLLFQFIISKLGTRFVEKVSKRNSRACGATSFSPSSSQTRERKRTVDDRTLSLPGRAQLKHYSKGSKTQQTNNPIIRRPQDELESENQGLPSIVAALVYELRGFELQGLSQVIMDVVFRSIKFGELICLREHCCLCFEQGRQ